MEADRQWTPEYLEDLLFACVASGGLVGLLTANAYGFTHFGYPGPLRYLGGALVAVGLVLAIPPWVVVAVLHAVGLPLEIRGRENVVELNLWLWVFCAIFYVPVIYAARRKWRAWRGRRMDLRHGAD